LSTDLDTDLHELFHGLREHDCIAAPGFESTLASATAAKPRGMPAIAWAAGGCALAIAAALVLMPQRPTSEADAIALPAWRAPTDFLLADAAGSMQRLSWAPSPTADFGRTSFNPGKEKK
jgi:hypothetical protein